MDSRTSNRFYTIVRSLHVFLLATIGLVFYLASFALLLLVCGLIVSACVRAEMAVRPPTQATIASCDAGAMSSADGRTPAAGAQAIFDCVESPGSRRASADPQ